MIRQTINTDKLVRVDGAFFAQNFRSSNAGGVVNGYSMEESNSSCSNIYNYVSVEKQADSGTRTSKFSLCRSSSNIGFLIDDIDGSKKYYDYGDVGDSSIGIAIDRLGEICWASDGKIGRTYSGYLALSITSTSQTTITISNDDNFAVDDYVALIDSTDAPSVIDIEIVKLTVDNGGGSWDVLRAQKGTEAKTFAYASCICMKESYIDTSGTETGQWDDLLMFENYVYAAIDNKIYRWYEADGSDYALKLTLPSNEQILKIEFAKTSYGDKILVYTNNSNKASIYLWDGFDTTWDYKIPLEENITSAKENYYATNGGIYYTNGISFEEIVPFPGIADKLSTSNIEIQDIRIYNNFLLFTSNIENDESLYRRGFYIFDLTKNELAYVLPYTKQWYNKSFYAVIIDYDRKIFLSHDTKISKLLTTPSTYGNFYQFIYSPDNSRNLQLKNFYINLDFGMYNNLELENGDYNIDLDIIVRYYDFREPFSNGLLTATATQPTDLDKINVSKTGNYDRDGYRVELIEENAGVIRNITAVDYSGSVCEYTLDEDITSKSVANGDKIMISPLRKLGSISVDSQKMPLEPLKIQLSSQPIFKRAMFEIEIRPTNTSILPRLTNVELELDI